MSADLNFFDPDGHHCAGCGNLIADYEQHIHALLDVAEAAKEVVDHVDLGIEPPGWRELREALARLVDRVAG